MNWASAVVMISSLMLVRECWGWAWAWRGFLGLCGQR